MGQPRIFQSNQASIANYTVNYCFFFSKLSLLLTDYLCKRCVTPRFRFGFQYDLLFQPTTIVTNCAKILLEEAHAPRSSDPFYLVPSDFLRDLFTFAADMRHK